ncbi:DUF6531 domain-containing protein [Amycolatopsis taiwanensis]|uniref:DUF6531 domain-containing protein n=1 Tax=Amycolatopsis taiwanensis TaxID=342230 RepID=A0A9W6R8C2_9PSEU|nr:DUF6531 domain-containing protein [Amycolatopsis taiwanensis]GLY71216.1 hypothetical protein Atai01_78350 [Amycolatopsis taiwanensis]
MSNPLVAQKQDSTTWHSGINILDDAAGVYDGVQSGSWIEGGISAIGAGMDLLTMAMNPVGTLISYGLNWLIEHVKPLKDALDHLAGDADQIAAYSQTWKNVAQAVQGAGKELAATVEKDTANWTGPAADTYRANLKNKINHINAASTCAETISVVVQIVGVITGAVRGLVRDMVTQAIGDFIQDALEEVFSLGLGTPVVVAQVVEQVSAWMEKIGATIKKLINSVEKLRPMMSKLEEIFAAIKKVMNTLHGHGGEEPHLPGESTHASSAHDTPTTHNGDPSTSPAHDTSTPTDTVDGRPGSSTPDSEGKPLRDQADDPHQAGRDPAAKSECGDPVDPATGEMFTVQTDLELPGTLPLVLTRGHTSSYRSGRLFGRSWASTLDQRVEVTGERVYYAAPDGVILTYPLPPAPDVSVMPISGARWPLERTPVGGYTITRPQEGIRLHFAGDGPVLPISATTDRNGNRIDFDYDSGELIGLRHSGGYQVRVTMSEGLVSALVLVNPDGPDVLIKSYSYDDAGRLIGVVNSSGRATRLDYDPAGRIVRWEDRNGEWYAYEYDSAGRVVRTTGSGRLSRRNVRLRGGSVHHAIHELAGPHHDLRVRLRRRPRPRNGSARQRRAPGMERVPSDRATHGRTRPDRADRL